MQRLNDTVLSIYRGDRALLDWEKSAFLDAAVKKQKQMMIGGSSLWLRFTPPPPPPQPQRHRLCSNQLILKVQYKGGGGGAVARLTKQGQRFLTSLASTATVGDAGAAVKRQMRKFVAASPKSVVLNVLSHLLSPDASHPQLSTLAFALYSEITEASWFDWNPKLVADLVALLNKQEQYGKSEALRSLAVSKLRPSVRDLALFYCSLMESNSKHGSKQGFNESYTYLSGIIRSSSSVYVKRQAYKSIVGGLCEMDRPGDAENVIEEMREKGIKPALFEFRSTLYGYGRLGLFEDMARIVQKMETEGLEIDTVCSNMVLSSYGAHDALPEMCLWLQKMKESKVPFSIRTYNSVLNSCPTIISLLKESDSFPLSVSELMKVLNEEEALLVRELVGSLVLDEAMVWTALEAKLDLHGMHLTSAYLIMMQWMDEMRFRLGDDKCVIPAEIVVVCGSGKHSNIGGESPVKALLKKMLFRTGGPMRIDRKNIGCFIAKGKVVKDWLL